MLNEFNEGGTHDQNPLGGIPQGMGQNGMMNTVEEGETKKGDFVYSDRIVFTPEVVEQFNLPKSLTGKTSAEASKIINKKFDGRNDKITNSTKKSMLDKVAEAQETIKQMQAEQINQAMQTNSQEVPDMMEGQVPQGMEEFTQPMAYGGKLQNKMNFGGFFQGQQGQNNIGMIGSMSGNIGNSMNTYGQQMNQSKLPEGYVDEKAMQDAQSNQMIDSTKDTIASATGPIGQMFRGIQKAGQGIGNSIGGESGAAVSGIFSPEEGTMSAMKDKDLSIGQKALATIPGVGGVIAKRQADKRLNKWQFEKDTLEANRKVSNFAFGGNLNSNPKTDPKKIPTVKTGVKTEIIEADSLPGLHNSRLMGPIHEIQPGSDKNGQGNFIYYKPRTTPGFNRDTDREFVSEKNMNDIYRSREYLTYMANRQKQALLNRNPELTQPLPLNSTNTFRMGGNMYSGGGPFNKSMASYDPNNINNTVQPINNAVNGLTNWFNPSLTSTTVIPNNVTTTPARTFGPQGGHSNYAEVKNVTDQVGTGLNKAGAFIKDNKGMLRYAPVAMNAFQLAKLNKEGYDKVNPIINNTRYNPQYMDEKALTNQINAESNYAGNALANASNGSIGALRNNILASQLNKTRGLSDAYSKIADVNRNENKTGQQFNLSVDEANIGRRIGAEDRTAMNKGAFKTEQSKLRGQIGTDLGEIGKEELYKDMAKKLYGYDFNGKYYIAPDGTKKTTQEMADMIDADRDAKNNKTTFKTNKFNPMNFEDGIVFKSKYN